VHSLCLSAPAAGVLHRVDTVGTNGRVYPAASFKREVYAYAQRGVLPGLALGELDHPPAHSTLFRHVNACNASHKVLDVWWSTDKPRELHGTVQVLRSTPQGRAIMRLYCLYGERVCFASRAWATLVPDPNGSGVVTVSHDLQLIAFDAVRCGSLSSPFNPVKGRCVRAAACSLLMARDAYWLRRGGLAVSGWPYRTTKSYTAALQHDDFIAKSAGELDRRAWAAKCPQLELMSHDAVFRSQAAAMLHIQLPSTGALLDADIASCVLVHLAESVANDLFCGHLTLLQTEPPAELPGPFPLLRSRTPVRIVRYRVPPPGLAWAPAADTALPTCFQPLASLLGCCGGKQEAVDANTELDSDDDDAGVMPGDMFFDEEDADEMPLLDDEWE
jgi:Prohead core protein serine protease